MKMIVIGGGWRSEFFLRAAPALPGLEVAGVFRRDEEKARQTRERFSVPVFTDYEALLAQKPDFAVLSVPRAASLEYLEDLMRRGIPVLCETPPAADLEGLCRLWALSGALRGELLVAEQYFLQPYHAANLQLIAEGLFGEIVSVTNSMMHGYHGVNMIRRCLGVGMQTCRIEGKRYRQPIVKTGDRAGMRTDGAREEMTRDVMTLTFEGGKTAFWDFSGEQYHSSIRSRHFMIHGVRGEVIDRTYRFLTPDNLPVSLELQRLDAGHYSDLTGYFLRGLALGERCVYTSPLPGARLNDDELAVAGLLRNMMRHIEEGEALCYPLADALQDTYLSFCLEAAAQTGEPVQSAPQPWSR